VLNGGGGLLKKKEERSQQSLCGRAIYQKYSSNFHFIYPPLSVTPIVVYFRVKINFPKYLQLH